MILLADRHIPWLDELLPPDITLHRFDGGRPPASLLSQADALLIRTVTHVDSDLLASAPRLRWIGTATAGFDHVDVDAVRAAGITLYVASGCNASAVGDYVRRAMYDVRSENSYTSHIAHRTSCAIIGYGHTGKEAETQLLKSGIDVVRYDPPLGLPATWEDVLACNAVSVHVPLTIEGPHKTHHLISDDDFARARWTLLIQASRGGVVDEAALKTWIVPGVREAIVDVWENEPKIDPELVAKAFRATPHIAGYSVEAKYRATSMCLTALLSVFGDPFSVERETIDVGRKSTDNRQPTSENLLLHLSNVLKATPTAETFKTLRNHSPLRHEAE